MNRLEQSRRLLVPALEYSGNTHGWDDIVEGVASGYMQLWCNQDAAAITQIVMHPQKKILNVFLAGGDKEQLLEMLESAKHWGRTEGCDEISMSGRRGWLRVLDTHGWQEQFVTMSSQL